MGIAPSYSFSSSFSPQWWALAPAALAYLAFSSFNQKPKPPPRKFDHNNYLHEGTGSFPEQPLNRLTGIYAQPEVLLDAAASLTRGEDAEKESLAKLAADELWRERVRQMTVLDFSPLVGNTPALQRAHLVYAFLVHYFAHSLPTHIPVANIPASLAKPLVFVSKELGIAPVLTFADTVTWNYALQDPTEPFSVDNLAFSTLFNAGTSAAPDETEFYRSCAAIELRGFDALKDVSTLSNFIHEYQTTGVVPSDDAIRGPLDSLKYTLDDITTLLAGVRPSAENHGCRPDVFYSSIRPWYRGHDATGENGRRWVYEGVDQSDTLELSGPSAGQTYLFHVLDQFVGVNHGASSGPFMDRMPLYMPSEQRDMIKDVGASSGDFRNLVKNSSDLPACFNQVLDAMVAFRTEHIKVATRYVISPSKGTQSTCPFSGMVATASKQCPVKSRGTGGNEAIPLLKGSRDATKRAIVA